MQIREFPISGLFEIVPKLFHDNRGMFFESFRKDALEKKGIMVQFVQDNQSHSHKGVLRGIHFQKDPHQQAKLVRVVKGKALDVAVDLRAGSATFGKYQAIILDEFKNNMLYIPEGFGHGFLALEETILQYKCTNYYHPSSESGIIWNDIDLNINWGNPNPIVSEKDNLLPTFQSFKANIL